MKRYNLILLVMLVGFSASAQKQLILTEGKPVFVYSLPKTELKIEVEVEKTTQIPGQFYQYAQKYLASNQVIVENKTMYRLKNVCVKPIAVPDTKRTFTVEDSKGLQQNFITVDSKGILCGVNVPCQLNKQGVDKNELIASNHTSLSPLLRLGEEYMMAGSTAKLAEGVAKQIYRIRESRMVLLSGDMDELPSDGKALTTMLNGLDKTENELTELFIGKVITQTTKHYIYFTPDSATTNSILFRLSAIRGLVSVDDLSGAPYFISIVPSSIVVVPPAPKEKIVKSALFTVLPAKTSVAITDGIKSFYNNQFDVPQFGVIVPISEQVFKIPRVKITIDSQTGRLLSVVK